MTPEPAHDELRLDIVGAGPAYTDRPGATGAAYLVRHQATAVLLDLGQGSFPRLTSLMDPAALDAVLISHLHPDHFIDLISLRHYLHWTAEPGSRVRVIAPDGLARRIDALHDEPGFTAASLDVEVLGPGRLQIGSLDVEVAPVTHAVGSCAFRVTAGGSGLVYSGDCGRAADLDPVIRPGDTLLTEVTLGPSAIRPGVAHLDGRAAGALAGRTRPAPVLLTHLLMGFDRDQTIASVRASYDGPVAFVDPGDRFTIGR